VSSSSIDSHTAATQLWHRIRPRAALGLAALWLIALALAGCGSGSAPKGTYTTNIPNAPKAVGGRLVSGPWTITFAKNGSYTLTSTSDVGLGVGKGSHVDGTNFVINPLYAGSCGPGRGTGTYKLKLSGNTLRFVQIKDPCKIRAFILAHTFTKVPPKAPPGAKTARTGRTARGARGGLDAA